MLVQVHTPGKVGVVVITAGRLSDGHHAATCGTAPGFAEGLVVLLGMGVRNQPSTGEVADIHLGRDRPDWLDLLGVADDQRLASKGKRRRGDLRQHLPSFVDDQQVDEVDQIVVDVITVVVALARQLLG
ncbi:hypothetical protein D3C79_662820 [compost metagenome]